MMANTKESRRHPRQDCPELIVGLAEGDRRIPHVELQNLSAGGMALSFPDRIEEGQELDFSVFLPGGEVSGRGVVRWVQPHHLGYRGGIEFASMGFRDRRRLKGYIGGGFSWRIPEGFVRACDTALFLGAVGVLCLLGLDRMGVDVKPLAEAAAFFLWN